MFFFSIKIKFYVKIAKNSTITEFFAKNAVFSTINDFFTKKFFYIKNAGI